MPAINGGLVQFLPFQQIGQQYLPESLFDVGFHEINSILPAAHFQLTAETAHGFQVPGSYLGWQKF